MDVEVLRSSLEENPNDLRPLNQALKEILADPSSEESQAAFDELLDILFDEGAERETLRRTLDARLRTLKGENEDECVLLADVATRYWQGIGAADRAEPFFRKLQGKAGYEEVVREFYTGFYLGRGNWRRIEELLFESAGTKPGEPEAAAVYKTLAGHARDKGDGPREAQYLDKLHKADPSDDEVVERLIHLNKSTDRWHVVAQLLSARAEAAGDDLERLRETYAELVKVYTDQMGVEAKALGVYQEWRKRDPGNEEVAAELLELFGRLGRWPNHVKLLAEIAEAEEDPDKKKKGLVRLADAYEQRLRNIPEAIHALEAAREIDAEDTALSSRLKELYKERRDFEKYLALSREELAAIEDDEERLRGMVDLARMGQTELRRPDAVIPLWEAILAEDAEHKEARDALADLYERTQAFEQLIALLDQSADLEQDQAEKAATLERIAVTAHGRLKDPARAAAAWERLLSVDPDHGRAFAEVRKYDIDHRRWEHLEELLRARSSLDELARVLEGRLRKCDGPSEKVELLEYLVRLYDEDLDDLPRALRALEQLHELKPDDHGVLGRIADLARRADDPRRLESALSALAPLAPAGAERKATYLELCTLADERLRKPAEAFFHAVAAYKEDPGDLELVQRLAGLAERAGSEDILLDVLEECFSTIAPHADKARPIALEIARRAKTDDRDLERSVRFYKEVLGRDPRHEEALEAILTDARARDDDEDRVIYLRRLADVREGSARADLLAEAGTLLLAVEKIDEAEGALGDALDAAPQRQDLYWQMESLYAEHGRHEDGAQLLERLFDTLGPELPPSVRAAARVRKGLAELLAGGDAEDAAREALLALADNPSHDGAVELLLDHISKLGDRDDVLFALERALSAQQDYETLADILEIQSHRASAAELSNRLNALLALYRDILADAERTFRTVGRLYRLEPQNATLRTELEAAAESAGLWFHVVELYEALSDHAPPDLRRTLLMRVAEIRHAQLDDTEGATEALETVAEDHPDDREVLEQLVAMYRVGERYEELATTLRRLLEMLEGDEALNLRLDLADILQEHLDQQLEALEVLEDTRAEWPDRIEILFALRDLLEALDRPEPEEEVLRDLARLSEGTERQDFRLAAGKLSLERLEDPSECLARIGEVFEDEPTYEAAIDLCQEVFDDAPDFAIEAAALLAPALRASERAEQLVPVLAALEAASTEPAERAALRVELADLHEGPLGDPDGARDHLRAALGQTPVDVVLTGRLRELARERDELTEHVAFLETLADEAGEAAVQVALVHEAADILEEELEDVDAALERHARVVQDLDPEDRLSTDVLIERTERLGRHADLLSWVEHALEVRPDADERRDLFRRAIDACRALEDPPRALGIIERAEGEFAEDIELRRQHLDVARNTDDDEQVAEALAGVVLVTEDPDERAESRIERARLLAGIEGREHEAITDARAYLEDRPGDRATLELLADLHARVEAHEDLVDVLQRIRDQVPEEESAERAELALRIAREYAEALMKAEEAIVWYSQVLVADDTNEDAFSDLEAMLESEGPADDAYQLLDRTYDRAENTERRVHIREVYAPQHASTASRVEILREAAEMCEETLGDLPRALKNLVEVLAADPSHRGVRSRCAELAKAAEQQEGFAERVASVAEGIGDPMLRAEVLRELANFHVEAMGDGDGAMSVLKEALSTFPMDYAAQEHLDDLYLEHERYEDLAELLELRALHAKAEDERSGFQLRRADVLADRLDQAPEAVMVLLSLLPPGDETPPDDVVVRLRELFERQISGDDIFPVLDRIYTVAEDKAQLADLLEARGQQLEPGPERVNVLRRLGDLCSGEELQETGRAVEAYAEAWALEPSDPRLKEALLAACKTAETPERYVDALATVADSLDEDDPARADLHLEEAGMRLARLEQAEQAEEVYRRVIEMAPERLEAYQALDRMLDGAGRELELAEILRAEADLQEGPERVGTLHRLADLQSGPLEEGEKARDTLAELLESEPGDADAHEKLHAVLDSLGDVAGLAAALRAQADVVSDTTQRASLLARAAGLYEELEDTEEATAAYEEAAMLAPDNLVVVRALQGLAKSQEDHDRLAELLQQEIRALPADDAERAVEARTELCELMAGPLDDAYGALKEVEACVELAPRERSLWLRMRELAAEVGQADSEVRAIAAMLEHEETAGDERSDLLRAMAVLRTDVLPDSQAALDAWAGYLEDRPGDTQAHQAYLDLLEREGRFDALAEHLGKMARLEETGYGEDERAELRLRQAEVLCDRLQKAGEAAEILEELTRERPADEGGMELLERIYRTLDDPAKLAAVLVRRVDAVSDTADAVGLLREVAGLYSGRLDDHENALYALLDALGRDPEDGGLFDQALKEARELGSFDEIIAIGSDNLAALEPEVREDRVLRLAAVAADEAQDPERAVELLAAVTSEEEPSVALLERQADLYERLERHTDLAAALGALVEAQEDSFLKTAPARRRAKLLDEVLEDADGAIDAYETLSDLEPSDLESLRALERLYKDAGRTEDLVRTQERLLDVDPQQQVALLKSMGTLQLEQLGDADRAAEAFEQASATDPQDFEIYELLEAAHATREDWGALADTYERWAMAVSEATERAGVWRKLAILREEAQDDSDGAVDAYFQALVADPKDDEALGGLERLHRLAGRPEELVYLYRDIESRTKDPQRRVGLLRRAVSVYLEDLDDPDNALRVLEGVLDLSPDDEGSFDLWLELIARLEQTTHKADVLRGHLPKVSDPVVKRRVAVELGRVLFFDLGDAPGALEAIESALDPLDETPEVLDLRADLLEAVDQVEGMQAVLDVRLSRATPGADRAEVRRRMARLAERKGEETEAIKIYEQALEDDQSNEGILESLAALFLKQDMAVEAEPLLSALAKERERRGAPGPELAAVYRLQGDTALGLLDHDGALERYRLALDIEPDNLHTRLRVGELAHQAGERDLARESLQAVLDAGDGVELAEMKKAYQVLGEIALAEGDHAGARESLVEVIALDPHNEQVIEDLVTLSLRYEDYEGALDDLRTLAGLKSNVLERYDILLRMAEVARDKAGDTGRAESLLQEAVSVHLEGRAARIELLKLYNAEERFDDTVRGLEDLADVEEDTKKKTDYLMSAAQVCKDKLEDPVRAVDMFDRVLDLDPSRVDAFALIDATLTEQRDWHAQEREYRKMLDRVRDLPSTEDIQFKLYSGLGEIYRSRLGDMRYAADAFTIARDMRPDHVATYEILADLYVHLDDHRRALKALRSVARLKPADADALVTLYKEALEAGDDDVARVAAQIMVVLRRAPSEVERYYKEVTRPMMVQARGRLDLSGWQKHVIPPGPTSVMGEVFGILYRALAGSLEAKDLRAIGVKKRDAIDPDGKEMLASVLRRSSRLLGLGMVKVYRRNQPVGITVQSTMPPCVVVGSDMLSGRAESELAFLLARHLALLMPMHALAALYGAGRLEGILLAAQLFLDPSTEIPGSAEALEEAAKAISAHIAPADAERLRRLMPAVKEAHHDGALQQYLDDVDRAATRAGLLIADDLAVAARGISVGAGTVLSSQPGGAQIRDLVAWMLSDDYLEARKMIGASPP